MDFEPLSPGLSVAGQIDPQALRAIADAGFRTLVCNRPDGEAPDQPTFAEIARAAEDHGLQVHHLPAESGKVSDAQAEAFGRLLEAAPKPALSL